MSQSPANFFFGAFDPAGTVSLDKIPGSFWVPALFVAAFGYSTWTVVLPNALAALATVVVVASTGRRLVSPTAGLIAGAVAATTPIPQVGCLSPSPNPSPRHRWSLRVL